MDDAKGLVTAGATVKIGTDEYKVMTDAKDAAGAVKADGVDDNDATVI